MSEIIEEKPIIRDNKIIGYRQYKQSFLFFGGLK